MLPSAPPRFLSWSELVSSIRRGETGWRPFALQTGLQALGRTVVVDGVFGGQTEVAVSDFQRSNFLVADGIAGPRTQAMILARCGQRVHGRLPEVPDGLMRGFAEGEGANVLAATNWSVPGGVDCGCMQFRAFGPPFSMAKMKMAFNPLDAMLAAATTFLERAVDFKSEPWISRQADRVELSKRAAVLAHNWPAGASAFAATGSVTNPSSRATWVAAGTRFPDGALVTTRLEWAQFYALGSAHGEAAITKYVKDWA